MKKTNKRKYYISPERFYNHGCTDYGVFEDLGNGTAVCVETNSCTHSIHEANHQYCVLGEIVDVADIISDRDYVYDE